MQKISLIAAVDENWGLGKDNQLLCHLPADLKHFKDITLGKPIIMGRKTYDSIGKALPGRLNIVLSKSVKDIKDVTIFDSMQKALFFTKDEPEVFIIGGAKIFEQSLPIANKIYLTVIRAKLSADVYFPELDKNLWQCSEEINRPHDEKNIFDLTFYRYERNYI